jgi:outer membrane protein OmpA-like peptidoglycan-associated protein
VFAILAGLSALFFTAWLFTPVKNDTSQPVIQPVPASDGKAALQAKLEEANSRLSEESGRRAELAVKLQNEKVRIEQLGEENDALKLRLSNLEGKPERIGELKSKIEALEAKLGASSKAETDLKASLGELRKKAVNEELKARLKTLDAEKMELCRKLEADAKTCAEAKAGLIAVIEKLKAEIATFKNAAAPKPVASSLPKLDLPMLISDPNNLTPAFSSLFQGLNRVKGGPDERKKVYAELTKDGKTKDIYLVPFEVGSSTVSAKEEKTLGELLKGSDQKDRFLVVGYASSDGDAASNRKLSSGRASNVARKVAAMSGVPEADVQAIYFAQTSRFDARSLAPNRVVEVWRLK